jgi:hypothetical protein
MGTTFIDYNFDTANGATEITVDKPTGTTDNDLMFTLVARENSTENPTPPSGWTKLASAFPSNRKFWLYYKVASSEGSDYTWTWTINRDIGIMIATYRGGFDPSDPIDYDPPDNDTYVVNNTTIRASSIDVAADNSVLIFAGGCDHSSAVSFTPPTSFIEDAEDGETSGTADYHMTMTHYNGASAGATGNIDGTLSVSSITKQAFLVSLNPLPNIGGLFFGAGG